MLDSPQSLIFSIVFRNSLSPTKKTKSTWALRFMGAVFQQFSVDNRKMAFHQEPFFYGKTDQLRRGIANVLPDGLGDGVVAVNQVPRPSWGIGTLLNRGYVSRNTISAFFSGLFLSRPFSLTVRIHFPWSKYESKSSADQRTTLVQSPTI